MNAVRVTYFESRQIDFLSGYTRPGLTYIFCNRGYRGEKDWRGEGKACTWRKRDVASPLSLIKETRFYTI